MNNADIKLVTERKHPVKITIFIVAKISLADVSILCGYGNKKETHRSILQLLNTNKGSYDILIEGIDKKKGRKV